MPLCGEKSDATGEIEFPSRVYPASVIYSAFKLFCIILAESGVSTLGLWLSASRRKPELLISIKLKARMKEHIVSSWS